MNRKLGEPQSLSAWPCLATAVVNELWNVHFSFVQKFFLEVCKTMGKVQAIHDQVWARPEVSRRPPLPPGILRSMAILWAELSTATMKSGIKWPLSLHNNPHLQKAHRFVQAAVMPTPHNPMFASVFVFCCNLWRSWWYTELSELPNNTHSNFSRDTHLD
jgi:hypothetical protein